MAGKVTIDAERCKGCELCVEACARGCLVISTDANKMGYFPATVQDTANCTGCALCAVMCPDAAIEVMRDTREARPAGKSAKPVTGKG